MIPANQNLLTIRLSPLDTAHRQGDGVDLRVCLHRPLLSRCGCSTEIWQPAFTTFRPNCIFTWHHRLPRPKAFGYTWSMEAWTGTKIFPKRERGCDFLLSSYSKMASSRWSPPHHKFACFSGPCFLLTASHSSHMPAL